AGTVDTVNSPINIGSSTGVQVGNAVTYDDEGNTPIQGLIQGHTYFARISGGLLSLYDTDAHAQDMAHTTGLVVLGPGTGSGTQQFTFHSGAVNQVTASDGITYKTGTQSLSSALVDQITTDEGILANYGDSN